MAARESPCYEYRINRNRSNGLSAQNKTLNTANLLRVAISAMQVLARRQADVKDQPILWFQSQICKVLGYSEKKRPSVRGVAEIAKKCLGRAQLTDMVNKILQATSKIGLSHLKVDDYLFEDY